MTGRECILCGKDDFEHFETIVDKMYTIVYEMCTFCGLVMQWPRLSDMESEWYNNNNYRETRSTWSIEDYEKLRAESQLRLLKGEIDPPGSILDYGCSSGALLSRLGGHWSSAVTVGVEPIEKMAAVAKEKRHHIVASPWTLDFRHRFDLITVSHVLEHIPHPTQTLYILKNFSKPTTRLFVEVPNLIEDVALEKVHLYAFTEDTLVAMLDSTGWETIWLKKHGAPKHEKLHSYLSVLARPKNEFYIKGLPTSRGVKRARRLGKLKRMWAIATGGYENDVDSTYGDVVS